MTSSKSLNNEPVARSASLDTQPHVPASQISIKQQPVELSAHYSHSSVQAEETHLAASETISSAAGASPGPVDAAGSDVSKREAAERAEILKRIAAFRNLQVKLRQDREKYYDETMARARSLLSQPLKPRR
ncbi:hypothetical protein [Rhodopseudomonas telluris]|uniref:Uncharacterized protein n=1 Tax=Rhodopseudomonas telluris TaxID=644215 RepID=A0ABV6EMX7_9BRAD